MKKCFHCNIEKSLNDFHNCKTCKDGKAPVCKICKNKYNRDRERELRGKSSIELNFRNISDKDYCTMWRWMESIGYSPDANISIHEQFCLKWGFIPDEKLQKKFREIIPSDCKKKSHSTESRILNENTRKKNL